MASYLDHPDYRAGLAAVLAAPDDDTPRLVLADWLEERADLFADPQGMRDRAEFVRVQCELARLEAEGIRDAAGCWCEFLMVGEPCCGVCQEREDRAEWLHKRQRELSGDGGWAKLFGGPWRLVTWAADLPGWYTGGHLIGVAARGFIGSLACTAADWFDLADAILAEQPVREVTLATWPADMEIGPPRENHSRRCRLAPGRRWVAVPHLEHVSAALDRITSELLAAEWPRVVFHLPRHEPGTSPVLPPSVGSVPLTRAVAPGDMI